MYKLLFLILSVFILFCDDSSVLVENTTTSLSSSTTSSTTTTIGDSTTTSSSTTTTTIDYSLFIVHYVGPTNNAIFTNSDVPFVLSVEGLYTAVEVSIGTNILVLTPETNFTVVFAEGRKDLSIEVYSVGNGIFRTNITIYVDLYPPSISVDIPSTTNVTSFDCQYTINDASSVSNSYSVNGVWYPFNGTISNLIQGSNTIIIRSVDEVGRVSAVTSSIFVDSIVPVVGFANITNGSVLYFPPGDPVYISGYVVDDNILNAYIFINGSSYSLIGVLDGTNWSANFYLDEGFYDMFVYAVDKCGNVGTNATVTVDVKVQYLD